MITPRFRIEQSENDITIFIRAPYTDLNQTDIHIDEQQFCFYSSPYYLRLHLPGPVQEDDRSKGSYDADKGEFIICLPKVNPGQHFDGLDMLSALMNPQNQKSAPNIEVLDGGNSGELPSDQFADFDWFVEQKIEELPVLSADTPKYGFGNCKSGVFHNLESDLPELLELQNPDSTPASERASLQQAAEDAKFCAEHYLADWAEEEQLVAPLINHVMSWQHEEPHELSTAEQESLLQIPRRDLVALDQRETRSTLLNIAELVFCWAHEQRCCLGDPGPESARSVRRLSAVLSWLRDFYSAKTLAISCVRRALCVPLHRNWNLALGALNDTQIILRKGRLRVLQVLLDLVGMFSQCESYHVLSQLYLQPYCLWIQTIPGETLASLADAIQKVTPEKSDIGWELEQLEHAAKLVIDEEASQDLSSHVSKLKISEKADDSDDLSSTEEEESSSGDYSCSDDIAEEQEHVTA